MLRENFSRRVVLAAGGFLRMKFSAVGAFGKAGFFSVGSHSPVRAYDRVNFAGNFRRQFMFAVDAFSDGAQLSMISRISRAVVSISL